MSLLAFNRVRIAFAFLLLTLGLAPAASAATSQFQILLNLDNQTNTGCDVTTLTGTFPGVEQILTTTVDTIGSNAAQVTALEVQNCVTPATDTFGPPSPVAAPPGRPLPWPVGVSNGTDGSSVIETYYPLSLATVQPLPVIRLGVLGLAGGTVLDEMLTARVTPGQGPPILLQALGVPDIPTLSEWALILLSLALAAAALAMMRRRTATAFLFALLLLGLAGAAWAIAGDLDGNTLEEWGQPLATETFAEAGADAPAGTDIRALFGFRCPVLDGICFRIDAVLAFDDAPTVTTTTPANLATGVPVDTNITVNFSENVTVTASAFSIECPVAGAAVPFTLTPAAPGGTNSFTLDPTANLPAGVTCRVRVTATQVTDVDADDPPDNMATDHTFDFATDSAPAVTTTNPANGATGVPLNQSVTINFNENVNVTASAFTLECPAGSPVAFTVTPAAPGGTNSFTLDPTADLPESTICTVTVVASQVTDTDANDPPDQMAANFSFSFTTDGAPVVASTTPTNGAIDVAANTNITVNFSKPVNVSASAFTLECPAGTPVGFSLSPAPPGGVSSFTLDPTADLPSGVTCTVTVVATQVTDVDTNDPPDQMLANYVFSFTVDAAPSVTTTTPANGAVGVSPSSNITIDFSENVNVTASAFTLECPVGSPIAFALTPAAPGGTNSFTLDPATDFPAGVVCTVTVVANQVTDTDANDPPDQMAANYVFTFTADDAPSVTTTVPANGAANVAVDTNITVNFSENVNVTGSAFTLECPVGSPIAFTLTPAAPGGVASFTLDPTTDLPQGVACTVTVVATEVTDVDANDPPDQMAANFVFSFTTDGAPSVTTTVPANGATNVSSNGNITVNFSEPVNVTGSAFTLDCPVGSPVAFTLIPAAPGGVNSFTLDPTTDLPSGVTCTVTVVATQVTDVDANDPPDQMAANHVFSFTTDTAPSVTTTVPANGTAGVAVNTNITVNFSENVNVTGSAFTLECPVGSPIAFTLTPAAPGGVASFTLDPTTDLPQGVACTVTVVATEVTDVDANDPPDQMAANFVFSFTTDVEPSVTTTVPANGAAGVAVNTNITVNFSENVNVTGSAFTLECPVGSPIAFTLVPAAPGGVNSFTLDPTTNLPAGVTCTVTVVATEVTDVDANDPPDQMAANFVFSFTTDAAPSVSTTVPTNGAANVATDTNITVNFSEAVNVTAGAFTLECPTGSPVAFTLIPAAPGGVSSFTLDPTTDLPQGVTCTVTVVATQVTDVDANDPPDQMAANFVFSFTTDMAPSVTTTVPANGATNVAGNTNITVNFSESVNVTGSAFTLDCPVGSPVPFTLTPAAPGGVASFTLDPTTDLPQGVTCTVTVVATQVTDVDANDPPDQMAANFVFSFTTDTAPSVTTTVPANGATNLATNTNITVNFSENVNVTGSAFTLDCPVGSPIAFTLTPAAPGGVNSFTLDPTADLPAGVMCTVTVVATQVTDVDANDPPDQMAANFVFSFTTDAAPSVTTTVPANGAISVPAASTVTINFSESVNASLSSFQIECPTGSGARTFTLSASPASSFTLTPTLPLPGNQVCTVTVFAAFITDADSNDPPDNMLANAVFSFTIANTPPVGNPDAWEFIGNTQLQVSNSDTLTDPHVYVNSDVLVNDIDPDGPSPISVLGIVGCADGTAPFVCPTANGGSVSMETTGRFVYTAKEGDAAATDSFQYTVTDGAASANATVTLTRRQRVWYVRNNAATGGLGRSNDPFDTLAEAQTASVAGDTIYVYEGNGTTSGQDQGIVLKATQRLIGEGVQLNVPVAVNGGPNPTVLRAAGSQPDVDNVTAGGHAVSATDAIPRRIAGLRLIGSANAIDITTNAAFAGSGDLAIDNNVVDNTVRAGGAEGIDINAGGTGTLTLEIRDNTLTAAGNAIDIARTGGTVTIAALTNTAVSGNTGGSGIVVSGAANFNSTSIGGPGPVSGGTTVIGASGNEVGGSGVVLGTVTGAIDFTDLDVFAGTGTGIGVTGTGAYTGATGTRFTVGAGVGTVSVVNGPGVSVNNATLDLQLPTLTVLASPTTGVSLVNVSDATVAPINAVFSAGSGSSIANATGTTFNVDGGNATITYNGSITNTAGRSVSVQNRTGDSVTFNTGTINDTGTGILINTNAAGAFTDFLGTLTLSTGANAAFTATSGGTLRVMGAANTIATTTGTALNVTSTTIGTGSGAPETGLRFRSISAGTAASGPANGIVLNNTGALGGLTVTGTGAADSGGTIQNTASHGVSLTSTLSPSFTRMRIQNTAGSGVEGTQVTNFTFVNGTIDNSGTGGGADDSNLAFNNQAAGTENNLSGTVTITNNTLTNSRWHGIMIQNFNGTIADAIITGNTITSSTSAATSLGYGINLQILGSATTVSNLTKATISGNTVTNFPSAGGIQVQGGNSNAAGPAGILGVAGSGTNIISIVNNQVRGQSAANRMATSAILYTVSGKGQGNVDISSNGSLATPIGNNTGTTIGVGANGNTTLTATTNNNFVEANHPGTTGDSGISGGVGVTFGVTDVADMTWTINGNTIRNVDGNGILAVARGTNGALKVKIQNNNVEAPQAGVRPGIRIDAGNTTAGTDNDVCLNISGNTSAGSGGSQGIGLRKQGTSTTVHAFGVNGMAATSSPGVETYVDGLNPAGSGTLLISATSGFSNCSLP